MEAPSNTAFPTLRTSSSQSCRFGKRAIPPERSKYHTVGAGRAPLGVNRPSESSCTLLQRVGASTGFACYEVECMHLVRLKVARHVYLV